MDAQAFHRQPSCLSAVVVILAAGRGERFLASGGSTHKLDANLGGKPILEHVIQAVQASGLAWHLVRPQGGTSGMGESIAQGVRTTAGAGGLLILPGDLPLVRADSLRRVALALAGHPVVVPHYLYQRGHPVGFRRECFAALTRLQNDSGAAAVVRTHRDCGRVLDLPLDDPGIALDVDTLEDLHEAERWLTQQRSST